MPIIIPVKDNPNQQLTITLDNTVYNLRLLYNSLVDSWTLDVNDDNNNPILSNLALVPNFPLIKNYVEAGQPKGDFVCNGDIKKTKIIRNSFKDKDFQLLYVTEAEIATL